MNKIPHLAAIIFLSIVLSLGLVPADTALAADPTVVSVSAPASVNPGEQFSVSIIITPGTAIAGAQFNLSFNPSRVTASAVTEGSLLTQGGAGTYFSAGTINNTAGTVSNVAGAITTPGQSISAAGTFATITMTASSQGGASTLNLSGVVVGDINGQAVAISVVNGQTAVNSAPVLTAIGGKSSNEGNLLSFTISASDADGGTLVYSASGLPDGASFNPATRAFSWTPRFDQAGSYSVHFEVTDGNLTDSEDVSITIVQPYPDWDVNCDGSTNVLDMVLVGQCWGSTGLTGWRIEDTNEDGSISVLDMIVIGQHWTI